MGQLGPANGNTAETRERQYWNPIKRLLHAAAVAGAPVPAVVPVAGAPVDGTLRTMDGGARSRHYLCSDVWTGARVLGTSHA